MADIPLRLLNGNLFGLFHTPKTGSSANGDYDTMYSSWDFDLNFKGQIDAAKSIGANCLAFFGSNRLTTSISAYVAKRRQIVEYLAKKGMYAIPYQPCNLDSVSNTTTIAIITADAAMMSQYPNVVGYVTQDEPWQFGSLFTDTQIRDFLAAQYAAVKAVVPASFPVATGANPCGNLTPVWGYTGTWKANVDIIAPYQDFFAFHPFNTVSASDSASLRTAYPGKQIIMPSSVLSQNGDSDMASKAASIMGLVGTNNFRGMCWFLALDYDSATYGVFNNDYSERVAKTTVFRAGLNNLPLSQHRRYPGKPRLSQLQNWGYR